MDANKYDTIHLILKYYYLVFIYVNKDYKSWVQFHCILWIQVL